MTPSDEPRAWSRREVYLFVPNLIGYARVVCTLLALWVGGNSPLLFTALYFVSFALDALDGKAARMFNQCSTFGSVLDMVTDRCSTAMFMVLLGMLYPDHYFFFACCLGLDISSHWFHMYATLVSGATHHKNQDAQSNPIVALYYSNFYFFAYLCIGAELLYMLVYLRHFQSQLDSSTNQVVDVLLVAVAPGFACKQFINVVQLVAAAHVCVDKDLVQGQQVPRRRGDSAQGL